MATHSNKIEAGASSAAAEELGRTLSGSERSLRILIQTLNYAPDEIGIAKYSTEAAEWLAERGHAVEVVTAPPYYPRWEVPREMAGLRWRREKSGGVKITRCPLYVPAKPNGVRRILHLLSFAASAAPALFYRAARFRPDVIIAIAPALTAAPASLMAARIVGAKALLHVQDFELDIAQGMGMVSKGIAGRLAGGLERALLHAYDRTTSIAPGLVARLIEKGVPPERVGEFRNWTDLAAIRPDVDAHAMRAALQIGEGEILALYSGNIALKQGVGILVDAARHLADHPKIRFVICGEGPSREALISKAQGLSNINFLPLRPLAELPALLAAADIHLLPQTAEADGLVLPSKLSGMLASGRPVVATVAPQSAVAREIEAAGITTPPADADALADAILRLASDPEQRARLGKAARARALAAWDRDAVLADLESQCRALLAPSQSVAYAAAT